MKHRQKKSHRWNPAASGVANIRAAGTPAFWKGTAVKLGPVVAGSLANIYFSELLAGRLPTGWQAGWKRIVTNLGSATLLGVITAMVAKKYAGQVFLGGVIQSAVMALTPIGTAQAGRLVNMVAPLPVPVRVPAAAAGARTVKGLAMADFLDTGTQRLGELDELGCCGQGLAEGMEAEELTV